MHILGRVRLTGLDYSGFWLAALMVTSVYSNAVKKGLKVEYQVLFRQELLAEDFHCDSETDQLLAAAIALVRSTSIPVLCMLRLAQPPEPVAYPGGALGSPAPPLRHRFKWEKHATQD